jgi:peptidyl-prolyl cis-trans isomerase B (cyclophilin B)
VLTRIAAVAAALVLVPTLSACGGNSSSSTAADPAASSTPTDSPTDTGSAVAVSCDYPADPQAPAARKVEAPPATPTVTGQVPATIVTSVGTLEATLDATKAPCTVNSFVSLADQGFYDNTPCHRLTTAGIYVVQCGDPTGTGTGGPGYTIPDEFSQTDTYGPGTLAMANTGQPNSGGSQFFVVYKDTPLPPSYTVFGHITSGGVKAIQKVAARGTDNAFGQGDGHPKTTVTITKVTTG